MINTEMVFVVDDNQAMRDFLRDHVLLPNGYQVQEAANGKTALQLIEQYTPDLILLDIGLPDYSGLDLLGLFTDKGVQAPIIVITAHHSADIILKAFRLGAKNFLRKPFDYQEVMDTIADSLAEARWQKEREALTVALQEANRKLQKRVDAWETLNEIGRTITATLDEMDIQRRLMEGINQLMRVEAGSLFLRDEATGELEIQISLRNDEAELEGIRLQPGQGIAGWVAQQGKPALVADAYEDERFQPSFDREHTGFRTRAVLAVPLTIKGRVMGVIEVINPLGAKPYFDDTDLALLQTLAASVAVAVENAWLYEKMRHSVTLETLQKTIVTLSHYVNNSLMVLSMLAGLLQDRAEEAEDGRQSNWLWRAGSTIQAEIRQLTAVLAALDQTTSVKETTYQGDVQMIDIQQELQARLEASSHLDGGVT